MPTPAHTLLHWHTELPLLLGLLLVLCLYGGGVTLWRARLAPETPLPGSHAARFILGVVVLYVAVASPLDALGERFLFSAHMLQHLLLIYPVPMLWLTGIPGWLLRPLLTIPGLRAVLSLCARPWVALAVFHGMFAAWHIPGLYEWALRDRFVHNLEHMTFLLTALLMWWPVLSPAPQVPRLSPGLQVLYLLALTIGQMPVFASVTFASHVLYPTYAGAPRLLPLTPLEDQQLGGMVMQTVSMAVLFSALTGVFWRLFQEETRCRRHPAAF